MMEKIDKTGSEDYDTPHSRFGQRIRNHILSLENSNLQHGEARHYSVIVRPKNDFWNRIGNRTFYRLYGLHQSSHTDSKTHGLQEAVLNARSKIFIKDGNYDLTNSPLQTWNTTVGASGCKIIFPYRAILTQPIKPIFLEGETFTWGQAETLGTTIPQGGVVIKDDTDDIAAGYNDGVNYVIIAAAHHGNQSNLNATFVGLKNLTVLTKMSTGLGAINLNGADAMFADDIFIGVDHVWPLSAPSGSYTAGKPLTGFNSPVAGSNGNNIGRLYVQGYNLALSLGEHMNIDFYQAIANLLAISVGSGNSPIGSSIRFIASEWNAKIIVATGPPGTTGNVSVTVSKLMITDNQDPTNMAWCNPSTYIENTTSPQWQFDIDTMEINYTTLASLQAAITGGAGIRIRNLYPESFNSPTLSTNPPVSTTVYQNTNGANIMICLPAYATTPATPGTIQVQVADTSANLGTKYRNSTELIDGDTAAASPRIILIPVRSGWFYKVILTGTTLAAATIAPALS